MGIKARNRMDLTYRNSYFCREKLKLLGGQISEVSLYGPKFFKHDFGHSTQKYEAKAVYGETANAIPKSLRCLGPAQAVF